MEILSGNKPAQTVDGEKVIIPKPEIKYAESLQDAPYAVKINDELLMDILTQQGVGSNEIAALKIAVKRKPVFTPPFFKPLGSYSNENGISIYADAIWNGRKIEEYLPKNDHYPTDEEVDAAINMVASSTLLHELKHSIDDTNPLTLSLKTGITSLTHFGLPLYIGYQTLESMTGLPEPLRLSAASLGCISSFPATQKVFYKVDPMERNANRFMHEQMKNPTNHSLVTLTKK